MEYDPQGDLTPILEESIAHVKAQKEKAMARHPSASGDTPGVTLTAADRCDRCPAAAGFRVGSGPIAVLDFCVHHWRKYFPTMSESGWVIVGANPDISAMMQEAGQG